VFNGTRFGSFFFVRPWRWTAGAQIAPAKPKKFALAGRGENGDRDGGVCDLDAAVRWGRIAAGGALRPPIAQGRLTQQPDGTVVARMGGLAELDEAGRGAGADAVRHQRKITKKSVAIRMKYVLAMAR
jgi:hypothetical protein